MTAVIMLKHAPVLAYDLLCDAAVDDVRRSRTRAELIADCETRDLPALKKMFEAASTDEAWTALSNKLALAVIPTGFGRTQLTATFESAEGTQRLTIAGKSFGISKVIVEVRSK